MTPEMKAKLEEWDASAKAGQASPEFLGLITDRDNRIVELIAHIRDLYSVIARKNLLLQDVQACLEEHGTPKTAQEYEQLSEALAIVPAGTLGE